VKEYIRVAAKWWADRLRDVSRKSVLPADKKITEEKITVFENQLAVEIEKKMVITPYFSITTDFCPCNFLADIAKECDIDVSSFPWKTIMNINKGKVSVNYGYGVKPQVLFKGMIGVF
jgi:hypothetical protein